MVQPLLESVHLLFHDLKFNVQSLVQFHETVYMGGQSIDAVLYPRKPLIRFISDIAELKMYQVKLGVHLFSQIAELAAHAVKPYVCLAPKRH